MTATDQRHDGVPGLPAVPPLDQFRPHKVVEGIDLGGQELPLRGVFYRRDRVDTTESIGVYSYEGHELFAAWGEVGRAACSFNAVRRDGGWFATRRGCPVIRPVIDGSAVVGFTILTPEGVRAVRFDQLDR